ncbi:hypothetical protein BJN45_17290 [Azonexus hydrophilus]|uniref:Uncharacterized protein n=1 Tax=Azonexus hydrophilus TaxID=418702 RepID=A0A1R1HYY1_9RHOO|nr:ribbon-helix-helix domain-containing protein [Azonexus hydrophilus]OMG51672.1 hypothetical protein BJN45_17290 [Azonexus hydrophilus]
MEDFEEKTPKTNGAKVIRATFSLPSSCLEQLDRLQVEFGRKGHILNRSEVVRIGLAALERMRQDELQSAATYVEHLKAGRPKSTANAK